VDSKGRAPWKGKGNGKVGMEGEVRGRQGEKGERGKELL